MTSPPTTDALSAVRAAGVIAVLRAPDRTTALGAIAALVRGGITGIEITYSTPEAAEVIAEGLRRHGDEALIGAGTITTAAQAREAADAGSAFLVSPGTTPVVLDAMRATGVVSISGVLSPSEVMAASELGVDAIKLFPASLGGPAYLNALRGPFPDLPIMPTGGVTPENVGAWFSAGAIALGAGGELVHRSALASGDMGEIEDRARRFAAALRDARGKDER